MSGHITDPNDLVTVLGRLPSPTNADVLTFNSPGNISWVAPGGGGGNALNLVTKSGDQTFTSTSLADITDLTFSASANTDYYVKGILVTSQLDTAQGYGVAINGPAGTYLYWALQTRTDISINIDPIATAADTDLFHGSGSTAERILMIEGVVQVGGSGGTIALRHRSENTNVVTVHQESVMLHIQLG